MGFLGYPDFCGVKTCFAAVWEANGHCRQARYPQLIRIPFFSDTLFLIELFPNFVYCICASKFASTKNAFFRKDDIVKKGERAFPPASKQAGLFAYFFSMKKVLLLLFMLLTTPFNINAYGGKDPSRCYLDCGEYVNCSDCELPNECIWGSAEWNACLLSFCETFIKPDSAGDMCKQLSPADLANIRSNYFTYFYSTGETPVIKYDPKEQKIIVDSLHDIQYNFLLDAQFGITDKSHNNNQHQHISSDILKKFFDEFIKIPDDSTKTKYAEELSFFAFQKKNTILYSDPISGYDGFVDLNEREYENYLVSRIALLDDIYHKREINLSKDARNFLLYSDPVSDMFIDRIFADSFGNADMKNLSNEAKKSLEKIAYGFSGGDGHEMYYLSILHDIGLDVHDFDRYDQSVFDDIEEYIVDALINTRVSPARQRGYPYMNELPAKEEFLVYSYDKVYLDWMQSVGLDTDTVSFQEWTQFRKWDEYEGILFSSENSKESNLNYIRHAEDYFDNLSDPKLSDINNSSLDEIKNNLEVYLETYSYLATMGQLGRNVYTYEDENGTHHTKKYDASSMLMPFTDFISEQYDVYSKGQQENDLPVALSLEEFTETIFPEKGKLHPSKVDNFQKK